MSYLHDSKIKEFLKEEAIQNLLDLKNQEIYYYISDLAYSLFEGENIDGVYFYNNYAARNWLKDNFDDLSEVIEEIKFQFDSDIVTSKYIEFEEQRYWLEM